MKIASIVGARPNFIKLTPVIREIERRGIEHILIHTGQHYDKELSDVFLEELRLPKLNYYLDVGSGTHGEQTDAFIQNLAIAMESSDILKRYHLKKKRYFVITLHRPINVDNTEVLREILSAFVDSPYPSVFPVHPRTKRTLEKIENYEEIYENILFLEPVGYLDFLVLLSNAKLVMTDSGRVQKESFMAKVPCITLKDETEWIETVELDYNILAGWRPTREKLHALIEKSLNRDIRRTEDNPYGDGKASERIVEILIERFGGI